MPHARLITSASQLDQLCKELAGASRIGYDTEFVSEHSYRPQLCLVAVIADDGAPAVVDPLAVDDLTPLWQALTRPGCRVVVHAAREEFLFCWEGCRQQPAGLFDVQLAAAFLGLEYPAGYGNLINRLLGQTPRKGETRTDWRRRPLTPAQVQYAQDDVRWLLPLEEIISRRLAAHGRTAWFQSEMDTWQSELLASLSRERWQRVSGSSGLSTREWAIIRELWRWREKTAAGRDLPPRRILRDDLLVEIAKRRHTDPRLISAIRGMERGDLRAYLPELGDAIRRGLDAPTDDLIRTSRRENSPQLNMVAQFLSAALTCLCRSRELAPSLVGTAEDVRDLIDFRLNPATWHDQGPPALASGWRAEVVGNTLDDLLWGRAVMRIANPRAEQPLAFEQPTDAT